MPKAKIYNNALLIPDIVQLVREGRSVILTVKGRSMRPFIEDGRDKVILVSADSVNVGDVVLAETIEKGYVIHRLVGIDHKNNMCDIQGDGNLDVEHCSSDKILAKVSVVVRKSKQVSVDGCLWKFYSKFWVTLLPIRRYLLAFYRIFVVKHI